MTERFEGTLEEHGSGTLLEVPFDVRAVFGKARAPVRGTVNGHPFRTTVATDGGRYYLGFRCEIREAAGFDDDDRLSIVLECPRKSARRRGGPGSSARSACCATASATPEIVGYRVVWAARIASISSSSPTPFLRQLAAPALSAASII
jgi:hypothetical protein